MGKATKAKRNTKSMNHRTWSAAASATVNIMEANCPRTHTHKRSHSNSPLNIDCYRALGPRSPFIIVIIVINVDNHSIFFTSSNTPPTTADPNRTDPTTGSSRPPLSLFG